MNAQDQQLNEEGRALWDQKAAFWDEMHGDDGNRFHRRLISPSVERLLALQEGEHVLDVACGNGVMARRMAALGGQVTAVDFSAALLDRARQRGQVAGAPSASPPIDYRLVDCTDEAALVGIGAGTFDAVVCTMALMDMPVIAPLFRAATRLLKPAGRLVFATAHPTFNSNNPTFYAEMSDHDGKIVVERGVKLKGYLQVPPVKGAGSPNEPNPHYYFHRPLHELLGAAFAAGLMLDALEEPAFGVEDADPTRPLTWLNIPQISPIMVGRLRVSSLA